MATGLLNMPLHNLVSNVPVPHRLYSTHNDDDMKYLETDWKERSVGTSSSVSGENFCDNYLKMYVMNELRSVADRETDSKNKQNCDSDLTHVDSSGKAKMVDVGNKPDTVRTAVATATIHLGEKVFQLVADNKIKKGDVLTISKLAGIMAAKKTSELIPLCHNIQITSVDVAFHMDPTNYCILVTSRVKAAGKTGVEMEAIMAVSTAAITIYDMCKAVSKEMVITDIKLHSKTGGMRGDYRRAD